MNGYTFKGSNFAIFIFASPAKCSTLNERFSRESFLEGKNLLLKEQIISFKSRPNPERASSPREANRS